MNKLDVLKRSLLSAAVVAAGLASQAAGADVYITEWMYQGANGEFIELTNLGTTAVDFTSWSYDDDSRLPDAFSLSAFGIVNPGESVILTESSASDFIAAWNLGSSVKVIGGYTNNLGRNDEINLFDGSDALVDRLAYGDQNIPGTIRTQAAAAARSTSSRWAPTTPPAGSSPPSATQRARMRPSVETSAAPAPSRQCRCRPPRGC